MHRFGQRVIRRLVNTRRAVDHSHRTEQARAVGADAVFQQRQRAIRHLGRVHMASGPTECFDDCEGQTADGGEVARRGVKLQRLAPMRQRFLPAVEAALGHSQLRQQFRPHGPSVEG